MSTQERVREQLKQTPGATSDQLEKALGISRGSIAFALWDMSKKGELHREQIADTNKLRNYLAAGYTPPPPKEVKKKKPVSVQTEPVPAAPPAPGPILSPAPQIQEAPPMPTSIQTYIEALASALAAEISLRLEESLSRHLTAMTESVPEMLSTTVPALDEPSVIAPPAPDAPPKKNVIICGLWDHLHRFIRREFGDCFNLTLINPDEHPSRIAAKMANADHVLVMVRFVRHAFSENVTANGRKPINIDGGISTLRDALTELYAGS